MPWSQQVQAYAADTPRVKPAPQGVAADLPLPALRSGVNRELQLPLAKEIRQDKGG